MERKKNISMAVIKRLPKYHRYLKELLRNDVDRISSKELGEKIGFTASQIRQDLNCFGDFGQQGYGYNVKELLNEISGILGLSKEYKMVIVGAGNIGQAIANYTNFEKLSFNLAGIFDVNPKLIGLKIRDVEVIDLDELARFLKATPIDIGVICVPHISAQKVSDIMVANGVKGIWNFAPVDLEVPVETIVENVHLSESLLTLSCLMNDKSYS
ncbi:redox-sensing transcriptional repressor Rex [Clostridium sp. CM028]|uniref:redox-sensing transcriptional repressor Rex n=1 Tax=Clostridium TaxID=1485 RepID=UPI0013EEC9EC|nr:MULTISPECIES: redox-sensing transcriptional repressor Rex [Clostridium]MBU3091286.1 redox-sensing transcriptional repressor Rex [Clostridium sp. CF011]MBW9146835.1 redox-sensing transcriptional repressor Rex [Clostridium sp. CM027]MBW9150144.1 redox-sensing transcriptional repressor Rex [Clostridium sp. CM028]MBZ9606497.1 redox-sensing transcriptional repressor Rex [Clostridium estertheticum]UVE39686.1 redox-sensing transcriptional repressor Rex [Clostridium sp. CM027]